MACKAHNLSPFLELAEVKTPVGEAQLVFFGGPPGWEGKGRFQPPSNKLQRAQGLNLRLSVRLGS